MDIHKINSGQKRRRLQTHAIDLVVIGIALFLAWRLFFAPSTNATKAAQAPPLRTLGIDGQMIDLRAEKGRVVFIDFFATWCEPCRQAIPFIEGYAQANPKVRILAIDVGEPPDVVRAFAKKHHLKNVGFDPAAKVADAWGVRGFPTVVGIDRQGRLRDTWHGFIPFYPRLFADAQARYDADPR